MNSPHVFSVKHSSSDAGISTTALYTCGVWNWGRLPRSSLFMTTEAQIAFDSTNILMCIAGLIRRQPSLRKSLIQRHVMINRWLTEKGASQIIELASGLSPRGAIFSDNPSVNYFEIDLPEVIEWKKRLLSRTDEGRQILQRPNFKLIGNDAFQIDLTKLADRNRPLFVVAEGLFMYFQACDQRILWTKVKEAIRSCRGGGFIFDLVPFTEQPQLGAIGRLLDKAMRKFTAGRGFVRDDRTRLDIRDELYRIGFGEVSFLEPSSVAFKWDIPFAESKTQQLLFACEIKKK